MFMKSNRIESMPFRAWICAGVLLAVGLAAAPGWAAGLGDITDKVKVPAVGEKSKTEDAPAQTPISNYTGPKKRLGIMDMDVKVTATTATEPTTTGGVVQTTSISIPPPTDFGTGLSEMLTTSLVNTGRFICLERKAMGDIQAEHALMATPIADASSAPQAGRLLGAQALIRGAVTEYSFKRSSTGGNVSMLKGVGLASSKADASVGLDIRIYDVATGVILDSVKAEGRAKSKAMSLNIDKEDWKMSSSGFAQSPLGQATREAIDKAVQLICKRMAALPWEGRIADVEDDGTACSAIYINAGTKIGLKQGDKLQVLRPGKVIVDPETKTVIGRGRDTILGSCRISEVQENVSLAEVVEGKEFKQNDVVRFVDPNPKAGDWTKPPSETVDPTPEEPPVQSGD